MVGWGSCTGRTTSTSCSNVISSSLSLGCDDAKEGLADYRYFPEPDLPPLEFDEAFFERCRDAMPELPASVHARYAALGLPPADVQVLVEDKALVEYFDEAVAMGAPAKQCANWLTGDVTAWMKTQPAGSDGASVARVPLRPKALAEFCELIDAGVISGKIGKDILPELLDGSAGEDSPRAIVEARGLTLDETRQRVTAAAGGASPVVLSATEFKLLRYFMLHPDQVLSKTRLAEHLYEYDSERDSNVIEVQVNHLRGKLGRGVIVTRRGQGYIFVGHGS